MSFCREGLFAVLRKKPARLKNCSELNLKTLSSKGRFSKSPRRNKHLMPFHAFIVCFCKTSPSSCAMGTDSDAATADS